MKKLIIREGYEKLLFMLIILTGIQAAIFIFFATSALNKTLLFITHIVMSTPISSNTIGVVTAALIFVVLLFVFIMSLPREKFADKLLSLNSLFINSLIRFMFVNIIIIGLYSIDIQQYEVRGANLQAIAVLGAYAIGMFALNSYISRTPLIIVDVVKKTRGNNLINVDISEGVFLNADEVLLVKIVSSQNRITNTKIIPIEGHGVVRISREEGKDGLITFKIDPIRAGEGKLMIYYKERELDFINIRVISVPVQTFPRLGKNAILRITVYHNNTSIQLKPITVPIGAVLSEILPKILYQNNIRVKLDDIKVYRILNGKTLPLDSLEDFVLYEEVYDFIVETIPQVTVPLKLVRRTEEPLKPVPVTELKPQLKPQSISPSRELRPIDSERIPKATGTISEEEISTILNAARRIVEDLW